VDGGDFDHPVRGRLNAWGIAALDGAMHRLYAGIKGRLLRDVPPVVVELGPGAGANLRYLPKGTRLIAVEPNRHMHPILRRRAAQHGIELDLRTLAGEAIDVPSESVDMVFASLVLCSVASQEQVLGEVRRVLRPGGRFACVEHVAAPPGTAARRAQRLLARPWKWMFEGCDLCRDTGAALRGAGFSAVDVRPFVLPASLGPIRHQIEALCVK
jgi:SAM-dependent methyltransferase